MKVKCQTLGAAVHVQGRRKQSADGQAQRLVVKSSLSRARSAGQNFEPSYFLAVRRRSRCTSASNWEHRKYKPQVCWELLLLSNTERKSYMLAYLGTYPTTAIQSGNETTRNMSQLWLRMSGHGRTSRTGYGAYDVIVLVYVCSLEIDHCLVTLSCLPCALFCSCPCKVRSRVSDALSQALCNLSLAFLADFTLSDFIAPTRFIVKLFSLANTLCFSFES